MVYTLELLRAPTAVKDDPNNSYAYVIQLSGNFVLEVAEEFNVLFRTLAGGGMKKVALDLGDLRYIDSTGIGMIITSAKQVRAQGGDLVLMRVTGKIQEIVSLVKLGEFIPSFLDLKQVSQHFFPAV
jgi:anti-sigma B factor antagonist